MMTLTEKIKRVDSTLAHMQALSKAYVGHLDTAVQLMHVSAIETPQSILRHVRNTEASHWYLWRESFRLERKIREAQDTLYARPHIWESEDGTIRSVMPGRLPNCEDTSTDETQALKMYADYKAVQAVKDTEALKNMEVPF